MLFWTGWFHPTSVGPPTSGPPPRRPSTKCTRRAPRRKSCAAAYPDLEAEFTDTVYSPRRRSTDRARHDRRRRHRLGRRRWLQAGQRGGSPTRHGACQLGRSHDMFNEIAAGNGTGIASTLLLSVTPPEFVGLGLQRGVFCSEDVPRTSLEEVVALGAQALPAFPESVLSPASAATAGLRRLCDLGCAGRRRGGAPAGSQRRTGAVPRRNLRRGHRAVLAGCANSDPERVAGGEFPRNSARHDVITGNACPAVVMGAFLADPSALVDEGPRGRGDGASLHRPLTTSQCSALTGRQIRDRFRIGEGVRVPPLPAVAVHAAVDVGLPAATGQHPVVLRDRVSLGRRTRDGQLRAVLSGLLETTRGPRRGSRRPARA